MPIALWAIAVSSGLAARAARADRRGAPTRRPPAIRAEGRGELDVFEFGVDILVWVEALGVLEAGMVVVVEVLGEGGRDVM